MSIFAIYIFLMRLLAALLKRIGNLNPISKRRVLRDWFNKIISKTHTHTPKQASKARGKQTKAREIYENVRLVSIESKLMGNEFDALALLKLFRVYEMQKHL